MFVFDPRAAYFVRSVRPTVARVSRRHVGTPERLAARHSVARRGASPARDAWGCLAALAKPRPPRRRTRAREHIWPDPSQRFCTRQRTEGRANVGERTLREDGHAYR